MTKLVIVESPAKAKTIERYLGDGYTVAASVGHVRDLPKSNKNAIDIEGGFIPHYVVVPKKKDVITGLKSAAKNADEILLATDPDREGEAIAWHLTEVLDLGQEIQNPKSKKPSVKRIVFHEITKEAVQEALEHPRDIDENLRKAQEARRVLDRLVGYELSELIWKKVRYGLSAGRVQSPALRILVEREREIRAFKPETYFVIRAETKTQSGSVLTLTCTKEPRKKEEVDKILETARAAAWHVAHVEEKEMLRQPRPPFTTSTLQQAASSRLGFSPARTMRIAQKLYEAGHVTYMRTDSTNLAKSAQAALVRVAGEEFGKEHANARTYASKSKNAQEAHEAIRPSHPEKFGAGANEEEKKLYELIWRRAVASQMAPARIMRTTITAAAGDTPLFSATGSRTISPGWLLADVSARGEDVELPRVASGDVLALIDIRADEKQTQPPARYSEAGLVKELEKRGIGRPSTYASIIKTLEDRGYVTRERRILIPTDVGELVSGFLEEHFTNYISDSFTSEMEDELDEIALGKREYVKTLSDFYVPFHENVGKKKKEAKKITDLGPGPKEFPCPACGKPMNVKLGRAGKFLSCSTFPECHGARTIEGLELKEPDALGYHPETKEPIYLLEGPYGPYVQRGEKPKNGKSGKKDKPKRASVPKDTNLAVVTVEDALRWLSLPRELGIHPETGKPIVANQGRFGPYVVHDGDFRSLKEDDVYTVTLSRALEILAEPKKTRRKTKR